MAGGKGGGWVGSGESHDFAQQQCNKGPPEFSVICVSIMLTDLALFQAVEDYHGQIASVAALILEEFRCVDQFLIF